MIARGSLPIRHGSLGPMLGRTFHTPKGTIMAKLRKLWEGLVEGRTSGTYIRPLESGYAFGRWANYPWGFRFTELGTRATMEACRQGLVDADKADEARSKALGKRHGKRRG